MLNFWSQEAKVRKKAKQLLSQTKSALDKNISKINPGSAAVIKQKMGSLEAAIAEGNTKEIVINTDALESASHDYLSKFTKSKLRQNIEALVFAVVLVARTALGFRGRKSAYLTITGFALGFLIVIGMTL